MGLLLIMALPAWAEESKIHFHGYGEIHYNDPKIEGGGFPDETASSTLDFHRLVWGISYDFNDRWSLHNEFDFEHAAKEIELEFAYLEYKSDYPIGFRMGSLQMPVGPLNEYHEPPLFYSVERPYVQKLIIPTSWSAGGVGLFGETETGLRYRLYLVEGLNAAKFDENGIKEGRQVLFEDENNADKFGGVGRVEYTGVPGLAVGVSYYNAGAVGIKGAGVALWDVDLRYKMKGFDLALLLAKTKIKEAAAISAATGKTVGAEQMGQYGELAYHLNHLMKRLPDIVPFFRAERFNTQGTDAAFDQKVRTYGLAYYPDPDIAIKIDREQWSTQGVPSADRTNIGVGFIFE